MKRVTCLAAVLSILAWSSFAIAQIPLTVQGSLKSSAGVPLNGSHDMSFSIFNALTGGSALWTEAHSAGDAVVVTNGVYATQLGTITPLPASMFTGNVGNLYLEVTVGTDSPMVPRQKLQATAYAN